MARDGLGWEDEKMKRGDEEEDWGQHCSHVRRPKLGAWVLLLRTVRVARPDWRVEAGTLGGP